MFLADLFKNKEEAYCPGLRLQKAQTRNSYVR